MKGGSGGAERMRRVDSALPAASGGAVTSGSAKSTGTTSAAQAGARVAPATQRADAATGASAVVGGAAASGQGENTTPTPGSSETNAPTGSAPPAESESGNSKATVSTPGMVLSSPGNDSGYEHRQSADGNSASDIDYNSDGTYSGTITVVTRDAQGHITSRMTTPIEGTWAEGDDGQRHQTSTSLGESTTTESGGGGEQQQSTEPSGDDDATSSSDSGDGANGGGDDDDDDDDDEDDEDDGDDDEATTTDTSSDAATSSDDDDTTANETKASEGTPLPPGMEQGGGTGFELSERTGGRIGGREAERAMQGAGFKAGGGGTVDPSPGGERSSGVMLTPEERKNTQRALETAKGGGVTDPENAEASAAVVTDRDLKELGLQGTGGAKGPTEKTGPAPVQPEGSPVAGPTPAPQPGTAVQVAVPQTKAKVKLKVDAAKVQQVKPQ